MSELEGTGRRASGRVSRRVRHGEMARARADAICSGLQGFWGLARLGSRPLKFPSRALSPPKPPARPGPARLLGARLSRLGAFRPGRGTTRHKRRAAEAARAILCQWGKLRIDEGVADHVETAVTATESMDKQQQPALRSCMWLGSFRDEKKTLSPTVSCLVEN